MQSTEYTDNAVDIWSAGVVLYVMITGKSHYNSIFKLDFFRNYAIQRSKTKRDDPATT